MKEVVVVDFIKIWLHIFGLFCFYRFHCPLFHLKLYIGAQQGHICLQILVKKKKKLGTETLDLTLQS
jgi:hypothetical protein